MRSTNNMSHLSVNMEKMAKYLNASLPVLVLFLGILGHVVSFYFHFLTVGFLMLTVLNYFYRHVQKTHTLLSNYGILALARYMTESVGPELRQYLFASDTEERPFSRVERAEVYRKAKNVDTSSSFGSQKEFDASEVKIHHSMFPTSEDRVKHFQLTFGEERGISTQYTLKYPTMISAMSFGSLGYKAVRALSRGARKADIPINTGEGGFPKYHLMEKADLIFQMGTAKFGVRTLDGHLDEKRLEEVASYSAVKMIEIKMSQGAKPGKGGLLPKEKISEEIAQLRGIPMGRDIISPPSHSECYNAASTVQFIARIQEISQLPVGMKICLGKERHFYQLISEMKKQNVFPDYITIDGAEGGTGAAPKTFMDDLGMPLYKALQCVHQITTHLKVRDKMKICAAGKLINAGKQVTAMSLGADATYTARGFMLAVGCIQALRCNANTCPVGITTHDPHLQAGFNIEVKSDRVASYMQSLYRDHRAIASALGKYDMNSYNLEDVELGEQIFYSNLLLEKGAK